MLGLQPSALDYAPMAAIIIKLRTGIAILLFGAPMVCWAPSRPTMLDPPKDRGRGSGRIRRSPAT